MKPITLASITLILTLISTDTFCQLNQVQLTRYTKMTVPKGKVWTLSNSRSHLITLSKGSFKSGTACYAGLHSNPSYCGGIICYDTISMQSNLPKMLGFTFKQTPYWLHDDVYSIKPYYLIKTDLSEESLIQSLKWKYVADETVFFPGMTLLLSDCITNLTLYERSMTKNDQIKLQRLKIQKATELMLLRKQQTNYKQESDILNSKKYNDKTSTYKLSEIVNYNELINKSQFDSVSVLLAKSFVTVANHDIKGYNAIFPYPYSSDHSLYLKWDSTGNVIDIKSTSNIDSQKKNIADALKLITPPEVTHNNKQRKCFVEASFVFNGILDRKMPIGYEVKKKNEEVKIVKSAYPEYIPLVRHLLASFEVNEEEYVILNRMVLKVVIKEGQFTSQILGNGQLQDDFLSHLKH